MTDIKLIEPLLIKLRSHIEVGERSPLDRALTLYGSDQDIQAMEQTVGEVYSKNTLIVVDLSPILSLGTESRLMRLEKLYKKTPYLILVKEGITLEQLPMALHKTIPLIICDENYVVKKISLDKNLDRNLKTKCRSIFKIGTNIKAFHANWVKIETQNIMRDALCDPPEGRRKYPLSFKGIWSKKWINMKKVLKDPEFTFFLSYQMAYLLSDAFSKRLQEDCFVVSNNIALVLTSYLQQIFDDKEIIIIDRIGIYPHLSEDMISPFFRNKVKGLTFCMVEDVVSTCREVDLTYLLIWTSKGQVKRVVTLYDLEMGSPILFPRDNILSLCTPKTTAEVKKGIKRGAG